MDGTPGLGARISRYPSEEEQLRIRIEDIVLDLGCAIK
jgi:hypothetical protein